MPFTGEIKEPRYRLKALEAEVAQRQLHRVRDPVHARTRRWPSRRAASSAPARRSGSATCAAWASSTGRRSRRSSRSSTRAPATARVTENRFTGYNHDYVRDDSHAFILREPSRCIDCGRCANVCAEVVGAACYDFMRIGFDTLVTTPLDMSLNDTPCVSCGRCAETCPTGALMPKPRVLQKYEVDESRCILCGICVDACPYDAVRDSDQFELSHTSREEPMIDLLALGRRRARDRDDLHPQGARLGGAGAGRGPPRRPEPPAAGAAAVARRRQRRTATGTGMATATVPATGRPTPTITERDCVTLPETIPFLGFGVGRPAVPDPRRGDARRRRCSSSRCATSSAAAWR